MALVETLGNTLVKSSVALVILPIILIVTMALVVLILDLLTRARPDIVAKEKYKYQRYDAGNPPKKGDARGKISMQYLGYLIVFLAVEPAIILFAILLAAPTAALKSVLILFAVLVAVYAPLLAYAISEAKRVESWMLEG